MLPLLMKSLSPLLFNHFLSFLFFIILRSDSLLFLTSILFFSRDPDCCVLLFPLALPSEIFRILFDSLINFHALVLLRKRYHTLQHFICKLNHLYFSLAINIFDYILPYPFFDSTTVVITVHQKSFIIRYNIEPVR